MQITLSEAAQIDGQDAVDWYTGEGAFSTANDFTDELGHSLHLLRQFPRLGVPSPYDTRTLPFHTLPYSLIYRVQPETIRVIAIAHHSRRPEYWGGRR
ncbi:MAG: type II toxin-antitoxin system RelE/ParE family toxin [Gammaproteobacteria bacterium]